MRLTANLTSLVLLLAVSLTDPLRTVCQDADKLTIPSGTRFKTRLETPHQFETLRGRRYNYRNPA